jgi:hypothetical protein
MVCSPLLWTLAIYIKDNQLQSEDLESLGIEEGAWEKTWISWRGGNRIDVKMDWGQVGTGTR